MENIKDILSHYDNRLRKDEDTDSPPKKLHPTSSEIPDLFFDDIIIRFKLSRSEIALLMYLYRVVWCRPNLYREFGIAPIQSTEELALKLELTRDEYHKVVTSLARHGFVEVIRAGQYFVRKYFTEEYDRQFGHTYSDFM